MSEVAGVEQAAASAVDELVAHVTPEVKALFSAVHSEWSAVLDEFRVKAPTWVSDATTHAQGVADGIIARGEEVLAHMRAHLGLDSPAITTSVTVSPASGVDPTSAPAASSSSPTTDGSPTSSDTSSTGTTPADGTVA